MFVLLLLIAFLGVCVGHLYKERIRLQSRLSNYTSLASKEDHEHQLDQGIASKQKILKKMIAEKEHLQSYVDNLKRQLFDLEEEAYVQAFGLYIPKYDFVTAGDFEDTLKSIKNKQKAMIKEGTAAVCHTPFILKKDSQVSERKAEKEGQKMTKSFLMLMLKIFNSECDDVIAKTSHSNINLSQNKIEKIFNQLNKTAEVIDCEITQDYLRSKLRELHIKYELACVRQAEKEREQELREREKEQRKLDRELKVLEEAQMKEEEFKQALDKARREQEQTLGQKNKELEFQIQQLNIELERARVDVEKANSRLRSLKEGYIYVISNEGSFRKNIYRICMTRRLSDPDAYISSMNPTVPFPFETHFKFLSEDATDTLRRLHERFSDRRVNMINDRREFFRASREEIEKAIDDIRKETGALKNIQRYDSPQSWEYLRTKALERSRKATPSDQDIA